jgi:urea transport system permease protein
MKSLERELKIAIVAFAVILLSPLLVSPYNTRILSKFVLFGIFAMSLDLVWGYAGILSFGHAAYFGLGAYAMTLILAHGQIGSTFLAVLGSVLLPVAVGLFLSFFLIYGRVSGVYFSIITLVVTLILEQVAVAWYSLTKGLTGFFPVPPIQLFSYPLDADTTGGLIRYFYMVTLLALVVYIFLYRVSKSRYGLLLRALRDDPERTQFLGFNIATAKTIVFAVSCGIAGLSGGLLGPLEDFISPDLLGLLLSTNVMIWVGVGGRGTLIGPFLGAIILSYLETILSGVIVEAWYLIVGIILVVVVLFLPDGFMGFILRKRESGN